jgi:hypothetical protein
MGTIHDFITEHNISMTAQRVPENPHMVEPFEGAGHFHCTLRRSQPDYHGTDCPTMTTYFSLGSGHMVPVRTPGSTSILKNGKWHDFKAPKVADVLDCLASDFIEGIFEDWCDYFGYAPDSRKAERIYQTCLRQSLQLRSFLGIGLLNEFLHEIDRL